MRESKRVDKPPYRIDKAVLSRFDERRTAFGRMLHDKEADFYKKEMYDNIDSILREGRSGYSRVDFAKVMAAWTIYDYFGGAFSWDLLEDPNSVMTRPRLERHPVTDAAAMSDEIKKVACLFGATHVGITEANPFWIYSHDKYGIPIEVPEECKNAIVMTIAMEPSTIRTSPAFTACVETGRGYSRMAVCNASVAEFIRYLGYTAIPMGNNTALSVPLAIDAGLGEMGRNGLLITPDRGSCVRICKVFTDLPLEVDTPIDLNMVEYCKRCRKCADACSAEAISSEPEPSFDIASPSNNPGIHRWSVDHDRCYRFWVENAGECSNCIAACPFTPL